VVANELRVLFLGLVLAVGTAVATACEATEDVTARAGAEAFRVSLKAQETDDSRGGVREIKALNRAADDTPGDPNVTGIADSDGNGVDDDGFVEVKVGDEVACVQLPESGDEIDVTDDACT
jgi:hypothetical protein